MNIKRLKSPGHVVWTPEIAIPKQILKGSFRDKKPAGEPRNRWEGKLWKDATKLLNMKYGLSDKTWEWLWKEKNTSLWTVNRLKCHSN